MDRPKTGAETARQFRERLTAPEPAPAKGLPGRRPRLIVIAAVVALVAVAAVGAVFWLGGRAPPSPTQPISTQSYGVGDAIAVTSKTPFRGSCRQAGQAPAFDVTGEVTLYANASRTLTAEPATAQGAATGTTSARPRAIGLDPAWWEALGRTAEGREVAAVFELRLLPF